MQKCMRSSGIQNGYCSIACRINTGLAPSSTILYTRYKRIVIWTVVICFELLMTYTDIANCQDGMNMWRKLDKNAENTLKQSSLSPSH